MPLETGTQIGQLDPANPPGTDPVSQADDHLRLIKVCVQGSLGEMVEIWGIPTNDLPLKGLNAAGDGYVEMIKVNDQDEVIVGGIQPQDKAQAFGENMIINGGFDLWQRGTSTTAVTTAAYTTADRFWTLVTGGGAGTIGRSNTVPTGEGFAYSFFMNTTAGGNAFIGTSVELTEDGPFKTDTDYTVSLWIRDGGGNLQYYYRNTIADSTDQVSLGSTFLPFNAGWFKHEVTFNTGANVPFSTNTMLGIDIAGADMLGAKTTGWKLEEGATATPFTRAGNNIAGELAMCQRYFWQGTPQFNDFYYGTAGLTAMTGGKFSFPATMRAVPSMALVTAGADSGCTFEGVFGKIDSLSVRVTVDATGRYRYTEGEYSADAEL